MTWSVYRDAQAEQETPFQFDEDEPPLVSDYPLSPPDTRDRMPAEDGRPFLTP
jgi:hypothetical protein